MGDKITQFSCKYESWACSFLVIIVFFARDFSIVCVDVEGPADLN